jgi:hypothetical protein
MSYVEAHMRESLKDHILVPHVQTEKLSAWYLKRPKEGRMMSTLIVFTVEGIVLMGDLTPCQNGVISVLGYGVDWFGSQKSESYLCEKFLWKEFVPELAVSHMKERLCECRRHASSGNSRLRLTKAKAREVWDELDNLMKYQELHAHAFYDLYSDVFDDTPEGCYGYNRADAGWLCAIQQRFAELYQARQTEVAA